MDLTKVLKPYNVLSEKTIDKYIIQLQLNTKAHKDTLVHASVSFYYVRNY